MIRIAAIASLAILAVGAAPTASLAQGGDNSLHVSPQVGNIVGGGGASITGGGDDMVITRFRGGAGGGVSYEQPGRVATFPGSDGGKPMWTYAAPPNGNPGREALLIGGGDNAEVVYSSRR